MTREEWLALDGEREETDAFLLRQSEVWCSKCPRPATIEIRLTNGETTARCDLDAWLLRAPRGAR